MFLADPYARKKSRTPSKNRVWNFFDPSKSFAGDLSSKTQCLQWGKPETATTTASEHSYFALYEAYGTRPYEWGEDPDRQKANTKEEETDLGLLNEGFRYRDLETGTFLTRDPIGYKDGPNAYCYVHCNPITHFDAWGLELQFVNYESGSGAADWASSVWESSKSSLSVDLVEKIESPDTTTIIAVYEDAPGIQVGAYYTDPNGNKVQLVDKADISSAQEGSPLTPGSALTHEIVEGFHAQNDGLSYSAAHQKASAQEGNVSGWDRGSSTGWQPTQGGGRTTTIDYTNKETGELVQVEVNVSPSGEVSYNYNSVDANGNQTPYVPETETPEVETPEPDIPEPDIPDTDQTTSE